MEKRVITKEQLEQKILAVMLKYNRQEGYMDFVGDRLQFFDEDPKLGDISAVKFTRDELIGWIENYDKE